jgi:ArsR family transcriptional regulator
MRSIESNDADALFAAVADPTRLRIMNLLAGGELCVCDLVDVLRLPQPKVSRHLGVLRNCGLVEQRIESNWRYYRLAAPANAFHKKLLDCLACCVSCVPAVQADLRRIDSRAACCNAAAVSINASSKRKG